MCKRAGCFCRPPSTLNQCLTVLEHASFACPANEQHLVSLHMEANCSQSASSPSTSLNTKDDQQAESASGQPFPDWLVQQIQQLQSVSGLESAHQPDWSCIQSALSVLINMSHNNAVGCKAVVAAGGLQMAVGIVSSSMMRQDLCDTTADCAVTPRKALAQDRQQVLTDVGPITAALGLLINLVENCSGTRQQLKAMQLQDSTSVEDVPQLLGRLMEVTPTPLVCMLLGAMLGGFAGRCMLHGSKSIAYASNCRSSSCR